MLVNHPTLTHPWMTVGSLVAVGLSSGGAYAGLITHCDDKWLCLRPVTLSLPYGASVYEKPGKVSPTWVRIDAIIAVRLAGNSSDNHGDYGFDGRDILDFLAQWER